MNLKGAVLCSTALHLGFLVMRPPHSLFTARDLFRPPETYVLVEPVLKAPAPKPVPPARAAEPVHRAEIPKSVERSQSPKVEPPKPVPAPIRPPAPRPPPAVTPAVQPSPSPALLTQLLEGAAALPEKEFFAIRHKELVREHLRKRLKYPASGLMGTVRLRVILDPAGGLKEAIVLQASDPRLASIAIQDARVAGPYPLFPKEMKQSSADYEFLVQYRPDDNS